MNQTNNNYKLNDEQFEQLQTTYIERVVENMSVKMLCQYVADDMEDFCNTLTNKELIQEIDSNLGEDILEEFITTIKKESEDKM